MKAAQGHTCLPARTGNAYMEPMIYKILNDISALLAGTLILLTHLQRCILLDIRFVRVRPHSWREYCEAVIVVYMVSTVELFVSTSTHSNRRCCAETWRNESILVSKNDGMNDALGWLKSPQWQSTVHCLDFALLVDHIVEVITCIYIGTVGEALIYPRLWLVCTELEGPEGPIDAFIAIIESTESRPGESF